MKISIQSSSQLTDDQLEMLCESVRVIACECPSYLVGLLRQVRKFRTYTVECGEQFPAEIETHEWLSDQAMQLKQKLMQTLFESMQREMLIDDRHELDLSELGQRSRQAALEDV